MRITSRIVMYVVAWTLAVLLVSGAVRALRDIRLVERDLLRDCALAGALMSDDVALALDRDGLSAAKARAKALTAHEDQIRVDVVAMASLSPEVSRHRLDLAQWRRAEPSRFVSPTDSGNELLAFVMLPSRTPGYALELRTSLEPERRFARAALLEFLILATLVVAAAAWFANVGGWRLVGRRVEALVKLSRAAAHGEPAPTIQLGSDDELDALAIEMQQMHTELARAREAREADVFERVQLRERLRGVDRLSTAGLTVARIAHEIGTPLGVVRGRLRRLERQSDLAPRPARELATAFEQIERIQAIVQRMLHSNRRTHHGENADLCLAARNAARLVSAVARRRGVTVTLALPETPVYALADQLGVEQVVVNLAMNAVQASADDDAIQIFVRTDQTHAVLSVEDRGVGFSVEDAAALFDPFFTRKAPNEGTGLGLAIVKSIVEDFGGTVRAERRTHGGARFVVSLPRAEAANTEASS